MNLPISSPGLQQVLSTVDAVNRRNPFAGQTVPPAPAPEQQAFFCEHSPSASPVDIVSNVQRVLNSLQYNFLPSTFFSLKKSRPLSKIVSAGREIVQVALPIRCLEATFVAIALTQGHKEIHRLPVAFKSRCAGKDYRHIVLCVKVQGSYGAVGLSRRETLMAKPLVFPTLAALLNEFIDCYAKVGHDVVSFKPGLFVSHDESSKLVPCWRFISVTVPLGTRNVLDHGPTRDILNVLELQLATLSGEYNSLPPEAWEVKAAMTYEKVLQDDEGEEQEPVSDSEENQRRISCLMRHRSPFEASASPYASSSLGDVGAKFSSKLRRVVSDCALSVTPSAPPPKSTRASSQGSGSGHRGPDETQRRFSSVESRPARGA